jgi:hypothetical protein
MGNFYTNYTLRAPTPQAVASLLAGRKAFVSPSQNGCVVAFDEATEQDIDAAGNLAKDLSHRLQCAVLAVSNHDDDILWYRLYERGQLLDEYDSTPGYFDASKPSPPAGGDAHKLCTAFGVPDAAARVEPILRRSSFDDGGYVFAVERHLDLIHALGLPEFAAGASYEYLNSDEFPEGLFPADLTRAT